MKWLEHVLRKEQIDAVWPVKEKCQRKDGNTKTEKEVEKCNEEWYKVGRCKWKDARIVRKLSKNEGLGWP